MNNIITAIILCVLPSISAAAQTKPPEMILPVVPFIVEYEYAPVYLWQDIAGHPEYDGIMAAFDPQDASSVEIILSETRTGNRVHYCRSEAGLNLRKMQGKEAYPAKIDFKLSETDNGLPIYGFGLADKSGLPVLWRVLPTSKPSIRGAGLTPLGEEPFLRIEYRDLGTTVGEGTAVKLGERVFEAKPWPEISAPPYFYAFHGSFSIGRHIGVIRPGSENRRVSARPENYKKGESWVLTNGKGLKQVFQIVSAHRGELVVDETQPHSPNSARFRLVIHKTANGYNLRAVESKHGAQEMRIKFEPELPVQTSDTADFEGEFFVSQGENKNILTGTVTRRAAADNSVGFKFQPRSPGWAKPKAFESVIKFEADGYRIQQTSVCCASTP